MSASDHTPGEARRGPTPPDPSLLPHHQAMIDASAISPEVARARGYRSITSRAELERLGFKPAQRRVPALLIPIRDVRGEIATYQLRPDEPRIGRDGRAIKYETLAGSRMVLDVPPGARSSLPGPTGPLFVTEGARKADAAVTLGLCCVALLGVWNWRGRNTHGGFTALPDWESIALKGVEGGRRRVHLVFDSDVMTKVSVHAALARLKEFLESRGAEVFIAYLPPGPNGAKVGLDDYLASGHGAKDLLALAEPTLRPLPEEQVERPAAYYANDDGMFWLKPLADGEVPIQLSNFAARIVAEVVEDDGVETRMSFRVEAKLGGKCVVSQILSGKFPLMNWPMEILGHAGVVFPGFGTRDHLRAAIQILSRDVERVTVYTYLGWRQLDDRYVFFHAGGAIGEEGLIESIQVKLPESLGLFRLPKPFEGEDLRHAADAALRLFDLAPPRLMAPLLGATFRVLLGDGDFTLHLAGRSGMFKSELASLIQRFFGAAMDRLHLPLAWSATDNSIEATAFVAKDVILTIDDLALVGNSHQISQLFAKVDRVIRAQGNRSARQRLRADTSLQSQKPPRGVILSTGEDVPRGLSVRARLFVLEVAMGDVDAAKLAACQTDASAGLYVGLMSAFIRWLAPRMDALRKGLRAEIDRLRNIAYRSGQHRRTPELVASVAVGWECLLAFLHSVGFLTMEEVWIRWRSVWTAIGEAAESQRKYQAAAEPANRFLEMVQAVISSSAGHLAGPRGEEPDECRKWGWRWNGKREEAKGQLIGWIRGDDVYLEPDAAYAAVQRLAREQGDALGVSLEMLSRLLHERGLLASVEKGSNGEIRYKVRVSIAGGRRRALHLKAASLLPPETPVHPGQTQDPAASQAGSHWTGSGIGEDGSPGQVPGQGAPSFWHLLPFGPVGPVSGGGGRPHKEILA